MKSNKKVRQREQFNVLMENWDRVKELSETSETSEGTADEKYESYLDSIEAKTERLNNAWMEFSNNIASSWLVKSGLNIATSFVENFGIVLKMISTLAAFKFSGKIGSLLKNTFTQTVGWGAGKLKQVSTPWSSVSRDEEGSPLLGGKLGLNEVSGKQSVIGRIVNGAADKISSVVDRQGSKQVDLLQQIASNTAKDAKMTNIGDDSVVLNGGTISMASQSTAGKKTYISPSTAINNTLGVKNLSTTGTIPKTAADVLSFEQYSTLGNKQKQQLDTFLKTGVASEMLDVNTGMASQLIGGMALRGGKLSPATIGALNKMMTDATFGTLDLSSAFTTPIPQTMTKQQYADLAGQITSKEFSQMSPYMQSQISSSLSSEQFKALDPSLQNQISTFGNVGARDSMAKLRELEQTEKFVKQNYSPLSKKQLKYLNKQSAQIASLKSAMSPQSAELLNQDINQVLKDSSYVVPTVGDGETPIGLFKRDSGGFGYGSKYNITRIQNEYALAAADEANRGLESFKGVPNVSSTISKGLRGDKTTTSYTNQQLDQVYRDINAGQQILDIYAKEGDVNRMISTQNQRQAEYNKKLNDIERQRQELRMASIGDYRDQKEAFAGRGILGSRYVSNEGRMIIHKRFGKNRGYLYADADGKAIQGMTASAPEIATQKALEKQSLKRIGGQMATGAAMGAMQAAMTTKSVGSGTAGKIGKNLFGMKGNEQEIEETAGDKAGRIAAAGIGGALGSFFGPIGSMIGSTLGEGAASIVSTLVHRSELEMKQRVADAKENLKRLDGLKSAIDNNSSVMTDKLSSSEDFEKLYKYTDELSDKLLDLQSEGNVDVVAAINKTYSTFKGVQNITTIADLCEEINNGNVEQRSMIQKQLALAEAQINLEQLKASQEEERYEATEKIEDWVEEAGVDHSLSLEERIKKTKEFYEKDKNSDESKEAIKELSSEYVKLTKLNKEILSAETNVGMLSADIYDLTTVELKDLTLEGVVGRVVKALEAQNIEVRNAAGYIKDEYRTSIEQAIKSNSKFGALVQADTKTVGELRTAQENFAKSIGLATYNQQQFNDEWNKWYDKALRGELDEKMQKLVYAANPERIKQFNLAWNATNAEMEELVKKFPDLNTAIGSMKPKELREYYSVFTTFFEDVAADSSLTVENLEKMIQEYPQLLKYYRDTNPDTFRLEMLRAVNEEQMIGYANALTNQMLSSGGITSEFIDSLKEKITNPDEYDKIIKEIGSASTFNEIIDKVNELGQASDDTSKKLGNTIEKLMTEFLDYEQQVEWVNPLYEKAKQAEIDYFTEQINNLIGQKEALGNVNDERKKEIELIKAKDALENAKKQKKRVYRAGIGWTYTADEEAVSSAKEQLDNLDVQKRQQDIQYQIDLLNAQKEILEQLDTEKQKEANLQALKDYFGTVPQGGLSAGFDQIVEGFKKNVIKINVATGKITDTDGNEIGDVPGLGDSGNSGGTSSGALGAGKEQIEDIKKQLASKEIQDIVGSTFSSQHTEGSAEWSKDAETFNKNKERVSNLVKQADSAGVVNDTNLEAARNWVRDTEDQDSTEFVVTPELGGPPESLVDNANVSSKRRELYLKPNSDMEISNDIWYEQFSDPSIRKELAVKRYLGNGTWEDWEKVDSTQELLNFPDFSILMNADYYDYWGYVKGGKKYWPYHNNEEKTPGNSNWSDSWATGTYSAPEGVSLINELGTEAIITPSGTVTALPAKTGIVPADITKNLWSLGEIAPTLVAQLSSLNQKPVNGAGGNTTYEEGQYFDNFTMNVYPAKGDDFSKILEQARAQMRLTRHNN